jgi:hypothetical protein
MGIKNIVFDFGCVLVDLDKQRCVEEFNSIGAKAISTYVMSAGKRICFMTWKPDILMWMCSVTR